MFTMMPRERAQTCHAHFDFASLAILPPYSRRTRRHSLHLHMIQLRDYCRHSFSRDAHYK